MCVILILFYNRVSSTLLHTIRYVFASVIVGDFAGILSSDRIYCCMPLYHSSAFMLALGCTLHKGCTFVLSKKFSASQFWPDCIKHGCTVSRGDLHVGPFSNCETCQ